MTAAASENTRGPQAHSAKCTIFYLYAAHYGTGFSGDGGSDDDDNDDDDGDGEGDSGDQRVGYIAIYALVTDPGFRYLYEYISRVVKKLSATIDNDYFLINRKINRPLMYTWRSDTNTHTSR